MSDGPKTENAQRPTFTERQAKAWAEDVVPILARHGIQAETPERSHYWTFDWQEETRPGRGHALNAQFIDGEQYAQVLMDVYGYPSVSVALLTWVHADAAEELTCEDCPDDEDTDREDDEDEGEDEGEDEETSTSSSAPAPKETCSGCGGSGPLTREFCDECHTGLSLSSGPSCHPACALGKDVDHDGWRGYRCVGPRGETLPFPGEPLSPSSEGVRSVPTVCIMHGARLPCREDGEHAYSSDSLWVAAVDEYQANHQAWTWTLDRESALTIPSVITPESANA